MGQCRTPPIGALERGWDPHKSTGNALAVILGVKVVTQARKRRGPLPGPSPLSKKCGGLDRDKTAAEVAMLLMVTPEKERTRATFVVKVM